MPDDTQKSRGNKQIEIHRAYFIDEALDRITNFDLPFQIANMQDIPCMYLNIDNREFYILPKKNKMAINLSYLQKYVPERVEYTINVQQEN